MRKSKFEQLVRDVPFTHEKYWVNDYQKFSEFALNEILDCIAERLKKLEMLTGANEFEITKETITKTETKIVKKIQKL